MCIRDSYNETPRMDHAENEKYKDLSQTFSAKKEDVAINDSRQLTVSYTHLDVYKRQYVYTCRIWGILLSATDAMDWKT